MAALTITAVRATANTKLSSPVLYGATHAVGVPVYQLASDREHYAADNNASEATQAVKGLTFSPGVDGGHGFLVIGGSVILVGATMTKGATYYLGATAGEIVPFADLVSGNGIVVIGTALSATELKIGIDNTGADI